MCFQLTIPKKMGNQQKCQVQVFMIIYEYIIQTYCLWKQILHQLRLVVFIPLCIDRGFYKSNRWLFGISEPSTVLLKLTNKRPQVPNILRTQKKTGSAQLDAFGTVGAAAWSQFRCRSSHSPFGVFGCAHRLDNTPEV